MLYKGRDKVISNLHKLTNGKTIKYNLVKTKHRLSIVKLIHLGHL